METATRLLCQHHAYPRHVEHISAYDDLSIRERETALHLEMECLWAWYTSLQVGLEPTTEWLTAIRSAAELLESLSTDISIGDGFSIGDGEDIDLRGVTFGHGHWISRARGDPKHQREHATCRVAADRSGL
jgi:hypothetical protein